MVKLSPTPGWNVKTWIYDLGIDINAAGEQIQVAVYIDIVGEKKSECPSVAYVSVQTHVPVNQSQSYTHASFGHHNVEASLGINAAMHERPSGDADVVGDKREAVLEPCFSTRADGHINIKRPHGDRKAGAEIHPFGNSVVHPPLGVGGFVDVENINSHNKNSKAGVYSVGGFIAAEIAGNP